MSIPISEIYDTIQHFVQIGVMEAVHAYEPSNDLIRKAELEKWLKLACVDRRKFKEMEVRGLIKPHRKGKAMNSPIYYSKKEIKEALAMKKVATLLETYKEHFSNP